MRITPEDAKAMAVVTKTVPPRYRDRFERVRIRPNEVTATDGTMAVIRQTPTIHGQEETFEECCVDPSALVNAVFAEGNLDASDYFMVTFSSAPSQDTPPVTIPKLDGGYPDIEKVVPSKRRPGQQMAMFDPKKMIQCLRAIADADTVEFRIAGEDKAVRMDAYWKDSDKRAVAVLMPMVPDDHEDKQSAARTGRGSSRS